LEHIFKKVFLQKIHSFTVQHGQWFRLHGQRSTFIKLLDSFFRPQISRRELNHLHTHTLNKQFNLSLWPLAHYWARLKKFREKWWQPELCHHFCDWCHIALRLTTSWRERGGILLQ